MPQRHSLLSYQLIHIDRTARFGISSENTTNNGLRKTVASQLQPFARTLNIVPLSA